MEQHDKVRQRRGQITQMDADTEKKNSQLHPVHPVYPVKNVFRKMRWQVRRS
jgi:hypothetical protein